MDDKNLSSNAESDAGQSASAMRSTASGIKNLGTGVKKGLNKAGASAKMAKLGAKLASKFNPVVAKVILACAPLLFLILFMALVPMGVSFIVATMLEDDGASHYSYDDLQVPPKGDKEELGGYYDFYNSCLDNGEFLDKVYNEFLEDRLEEMVLNECAKAGIEPTPRQLKKMKKFLLKEEHGLYWMLKHDYEINYEITFIALNIGQQVRNEGQVPTDYNHDDFEDWCRDINNLAKLVGFSVSLEPNPDAYYTDENGNQVRNDDEDEFMIVPNIRPFCYENVFAFAGIEDVNATMGINTTVWDFYQAHLEGFDDLIDNLPSDYYKEEVTNALHRNARMLWLKDYEDEYTLMLYELQLANAEMGVPIMYQSDYHGFYMKDSKGNLLDFGSYGCKATCYMMIASYFSGKNLTPDMFTTKNLNDPNYNISFGNVASYVRKQADNKVDFTSATFSSDDNKKLEQMSSHIEKGEPMIIHFHEGDYTRNATNGHYVVVVGMEGNNFIVNDPNKGNATKSYSIEKVLSNMTDSYDYGSSAMPEQYYDGTFTNF